jgi:hypothetical protein
MSRTVDCRGDGRDPLHRSPQLLAALLALLLVAGPAGAQRELPRPSPENTLKVYLLDPGLLNPDLTLDAKVDRARDLLRRIDPGGLYVGVGVALPYRPSGEEAFEAAFRTRIPIALLGGPTTHHTHDWLPADTVTSDLRNAQWLADGTLGLGSERERLWACASVYASEIVAHRTAASRAMAERVTEIEASHPGVVDLVAGPLEHGLSTTGYPDRYADYSPWTVAEFRDWLTHRGIYGPDGSRAGEGWPGGAHLADDPSPARSAGEGRSFNEVFGTSFESWHLRIHEPTRGGPIVDTSVLSPGPGDGGYLRGGFDAPRAPNTLSPLWAAWTQFRAELVRHWAEDHLPELRSALPHEVSAAAVVHLPGDPAWAALSAGAAEPEGADLVLFDGRPADILEAAAARDSAVPWGAIVDVPVPMPADSSARGWLGPLVDRGARVLVIRAWEDSSGGYGALALSNLEAEVAGWLETMDDRPRGAKPGERFAPPAVREVAVEQQEDGNRVTWSTHPFEGIAIQWRDWQPFSEFAVSRTHPQPLRLGTTTDAHFIDVDPPQGARYEVRALVR